MSSEKNDRLEAAARAGWLYYVAGENQDRIAAILGVSRPSAQRLVALAVSAGLVRVRIEHPLARSLDLARALTDRFGLSFCEVAPTDPLSDSTTLGVAQPIADQLEKRLRAETPTLIGVGTGRTLKAAAELLPRIDCPQHKVVSLTGAIGPDGAAAYYNVIFILADRLSAPAYPLPVPVVASSAEERDLLHRQPTIRSALEMAARLDVAFLGVGEFDERAPLFMDRFISAGERDSMRAAGAVGELIGWAFDREGVWIEGGSNARVAGAPPPRPEGGRLVIGCAMGARKLPAVGGALKGRLLNGLIVDEAMAEGLLKGPWAPG
ncbi:sugar-binding transcriptional regulator [Neomegalonema sp.]|uniref:sugar-binding transcriptional regulator n=1 Tax=Neomegalonema sp. TaxID=2039713 RepID=UPI00261071E7|nr:sugar-binding transcriptional regulator [Neomegalonema sp.]MDD2868512.1 sugar-binding transcriptional regulator [Neomegalonema sp.]